MSGLRALSRVLLRQDIGIRNLSVICRPSSGPSIRENLRIRSFASEEKVSQPEVDDKVLREEFDALLKQLDEYKEKTLSLDDKYKRSLADGENLRKRMMKQVEDAKLFSIQSFCKDLLAVADTLSKATDSVPKDQIKESNPHLKSLYDGLTLTEAQLLQVFKRHGLEVVNPLHEKFDPNLHEALFVQEVNGAEPGSVVVVSKVGYKLQDRCIRPALVGVAKGA